MDQHQARRGCGCTEQGKMLHNDVEQAWLVVLAHLWHLNLPYWSHDLPQVSDFRIQGEKEQYSHIIVLEFELKEVSQWVPIIKLTYLNSISSIPCVTYLKFKPWCTAFWHTNAVFHIPTFWLTMKQLHESVQTLRHFFEPLYIISMHLCAAMDQ